MCVSVSMDNNFLTRLNELRLGYLICWFILTPSRSRSKVTIFGQSLRTLDEKAVGATSSEGFLVSLCRLRLATQTNESMATRNGIAVVIYKQR